MSGDGGNTEGRQVEIETALQVLGRLCEALMTPQQPDEALACIVQMTRDLMGTGQTVILLRDEERGELIVHAAVGINGQSVRVGHPLGVPARLKRILWQVERLHQIGSIATGIEGIGFPILVIPLRVKGERVGLLITGKLLGGKPKFSQLERRAFLLVASFASLIIENAKAHDYLRQQFAQRSRELLEESQRDAEPGEETRRLMIASLRNPTKVVRLLTVSFYRELVRAGFGPDHMASAAAEIIDCINRQEKVDQPAAHG